MDINTKIRTFLKTHNTIPTLIGPIVLQPTTNLSGGNGLVYKANWKNRDVAVKVLTFDQTSNSKSNRFYDEIAIQLFSGDENLGIGKVLYFGTLEIENQKFSYYVMPYHELSLKTWREKLTPQERIEKGPIIFNSLLRILKELESKNYIHRDFKPENILVKPNEDIILIDFGLAWFNTEELEKLSETKKGEKVANYLFSAPEQATGAKPDKRMDFYAVGQILQWFITGQTHRGTGRERLTQSADILRLDGLVEILLSNDPNKRPSSVLEMFKYLSDHDENKRRSAFESKSLASIQSFSDVLRMSFPGEKNAFLVDGKDHIDRFLALLSNNLVSIDLEGVYPHKFEGAYTATGSDTVQTIVRKGEYWAFDSEEILIDKIWIFRFPTQHKQFFLVKTKPSEPFPDGRWNTSLYQGQYIDPKFADDGYMIVNNEPVYIGDNIVNCIRSNEVEYRFYAPNGSSITFHENEDRLLNAVNLIENGANEIDILNQFRSLRTSPRLPNF